MRQEAFWRVFMANRGDGGELLRENALQRDNDGCRPSPAGCGQMNLAGPVAPATQNIAAKEHINEPGRYPRLHEQTNQHARRTDGTQPRCRTPAMGRPMAERQGTSCANGLDGRRVRETLELCSSRKNARRSHSRSHRLPRAGNIGLIMNWRVLGTCHFSPGQQLYL